MTPTPSAAVIVLMILNAPFVALGQQKNTIDSLRTELDRHSGDSLSVRILSLLSNEFARTDLQKARDHVYQAIARARELNTTFALSGCYAQLAAQHQQAGGLDSAMFYLDKLRELSQKHPPDTAAIANFHFAAGLFHKNRGELELALFHVLKGIDHLVDPKHQLTKAGQYLNVGNIYLNRGELRNAAEYHLQALRLFEKLDNKRGQSFCLQSLGSDFLRLKRYDESVKYYQQSLAIKQELNDSRGLVTSWMGLGNVYAESGRLPEAIKHYKLALHQAREMKLTNEEARALFDLGLVEKSLRNSDAASTHFRQALSIARDRGDSLLSSAIQVELASLRPNSTATAHETLMNNVRVAESHGDMLGTAEAYLKLAEWNYANKNFQKAYDLLRTHYHINDSLRGEAVQIRLKEMQEEYEIEKKEREIALLKKDQELKEAIIDRQDARQQIILTVLVFGVIVMAVLIHYYRNLNRSRRLIDIEKVRNNIARDLHDDIGSALSSIQIMSQVALRGNDPQGSLVRISDNATRTMESMSDIVWSINPDNDTIDQMIIRMKQFAAEILEPKNIRYAFEIPTEIGNTRLGVDMRKNMFLIFKESVNNAAKYSGGTQVTISLKRTGSNLVLAVRDNGKGFNTQNVRNGNGLVNMTQRAASLNGTLICTSHPGEGTDVVAELPIT